MQKYYISVDMEGLNGVVYEQQVVSSDSQSYKNSRKQLHFELNTVLKVLMDCGIENITVNDAHSTMDNILISELPDNVELITGKPKDISMMHNLDESYSGVFFIGYHAKAGSQKGVLAHTFNQKFKFVKINDVLVGEDILNAIYAGLKRVPIVFASGDDIFCKQIKEDIGDITTVTTKTAISRTAAKCKTNQNLYEDLIKGVKHALKSKDKRVLYDKIKPPYKLNIAFFDKKYAENCSLITSAMQVSPDEIEFISDDYEEVYKTMQSISSGCN